MSISVIYPAYNETAIIDKTIRRSMAALRTQFDAFEIILVNDGSTDDTGAKADVLAAEFPELVVIHQANTGVGGALYRGLLQVRNDWVVHNGMDYPFDLEDLRKLTPFLIDHDVVVAGRTGYASYTAFRWLVSKINRALLHTLFRVPAADCNFVQLYRREVIESCLPQSRAAGFIVPEMLIRALALGYRIVELPIHYHGRETGFSTLGKPKVLWRTFRDMILFWWRFQVCRKRHAFREDGSLTSKG